MNRDRDTRTEGEVRIQPLLGDLVRRLVAEYAPQKVILFGSHAHGEPGPDSDIDLLVIKDTAERFLDRLRQVRRILAGDRQEVALEVLVLTPQELRERLAAGDQFVAEILQTGRVLYAP